MIFTRRKAIEDVKNTEYGNFDNAAPNAEHINKKDISIKTSELKVRRKNLSKTACLTMNIVHLPNDNIGHAIL